MKQKKIIAVVLTLLVIFILPMVAHAANTNRFRGNNAYANFESFDGCVNVYTSVLAVEEIVNSTRQAKAFVTIFRDDWCNSVYSYAYGEADLSDPQSFTINQVHSAHLETAVTVTDYDANVSYNVDIDLTWTGTGDISRGQSKQKYSSGGCKYQYSNKGSYRAANASGSIFDGATEYASGTSYAELSQSKSGEIVVTCG